MKPSEKDPTIVEVPIEELDFTMSTYNCLKHEGVDDIGQLAGMTDEELVDVSNLGMKNVDEIRSKLAEYEEDWR
jgi:DNA-directed RNA polymerase subunit alpha